jgi:hypothetical protein
MFYDPVECVYCGFVITNELVPPSPEIVLHVCTDLCGHPICYGVGYGRIYGCPDHMKIHQVSLLPHRPETKNNLQGDRGESVEA